MTKNQNNTDKSQKEKKKGRKKRKRRFWFYLLFTFFMVAATLQTIFYFFATPLLRETLQTLVYQESEGLYSIDFSELKINLSTRSFYMDDFYLIPDSVMYVELKNNNKIDKAAYKIQVKKLAINQLSITKLFTISKLQINEIRVEEPKIGLLGAPNSAKKKKYDAVHNDLYPIFSQYFKQLAINKIKIIDGYFDLYISPDIDEQSAIVENIQIELENFYLNKNAHLERKKLFFSENIHLITTNYNIILADSTHLLTADSVIISTKDSLIKATNITLAPEMIQIKKSKLNTDIYNLFIPEIKVKHYNLADAYFHKKIHVREIAMIKPSMEIANSKKKKRENRDSVSISYRTDWYELIEDKIKLIDVESFKIISANLNQYHETFRSKPNFQIKDFNLKLFSFHIDSLASYQKNKILYSDDIELKVSKYKMYLSNRLHVLFASNVYVSTNQGKISANNVNLRTLLVKDSLYKFKNQAWFSITVPSVIMTGMNLHQAYNFQILNVAQMYLYRPKFEYEKFNYNSNKSKKRRSASDFYMITKDYLQTVMVQNFIIKNGDFNFATHHIQLKDSIYFSGKLDLSLNRFLLDKNSRHGPEQFFYTNDMEFNISKLKIKTTKAPYIYTASNIKLSTKNKSIDIDNFKVKNISRSQSIDVLKKYNKNMLFDLDIATIKIRNTDIHQAYFNKKLIVNSIKIAKPRIEINRYKDYKIVEHDSVYKKITDSISYQFNEDSLKNNIPEIEEKIKQMIPDYLAVFKIKKLQLDSGYIKINEKDTFNHIKSSTDNAFQVKLENFYFNRNDSNIYENKILLTDNIEVLIRNYSFTLPDKIHLLKANNILFSTKNSSLSAKQILISPKMELKDTIRHYNAYFPNIKLDGINYKELINNQNIYIDSIRLDNPVFISILPEKFKSNKKRQRKTVKKRNIWLGKIIVNNANVGKINDYGWYGKKTMKGNLSLKINNLKIDTAKTKSNEQLASVGGVCLNLKDFFIELKDSIHVVRIDSVKKNNVIDTTWIYGLHYTHPPEINLNPKFLKPKNMIFDFYISEANIINLNFEELLFNKSINSKLVNINSPIFEIVQLDNNNPKKEIRNFNFYPKIKKGLKEISANKIQLYNGEFAFKSNKKNNKIKLKNIDGAIDHLIIDSLKRNYLLNSENISLTLNNYEAYFGDSLYHIQTNKVTVNTKDSSLFVDFLDLRPVYKRYIFPHRFQHQKAAIYTTGDKLKVSGLDIAAIIDKKSIKAKQVSLGNYRLHVFKNNNYPADTTKQIPNLHKMINNISYNLEIDSVKIDSSYIAYEQISEEAVIPGTISLEKINGHIINLTNNKARRDTNKLMRLSANTYLMGKGKMDVNIRIPYNSKKDEYYCMAELDTMNLTALNPVMERLMFIKIENGTAKPSELFFSVTNDYAEGTMKLRYNNLKIAVQKKDTTSSGKRGISSMVANTILRADNPKKDLGRLKEGYIFYKPLPYRPVFHYWVNAGLSGLKSTFGFETTDMKKKKRIDRKLSKIASKESREQRRRERKNKKEMLKELKRNQKREEKQKKAENKKKNKNNE